MIETLENINENDFKFVRVFLLYLILLKNIVQKY